jgi:predicted aminopeptidase
MRARRPRRAPTVPALVLAAAALGLAGCSDIEFYLQGVAGQAELLARARPIAEVVETTPDAALKARLERVQAIRAFATRELGLPDNRSYTTYADLGRPYVVWNVFAAPELSLVPRQWCFPVAGCVAYRGYFAESDARGEAARLAATGDDVHVGGVPAYSTLGYFDDPVLSTFVRFREVELARLVFHELAHQVVYVKDDTSFNESFATAVEEAGTERWLAAERAKRGSAAAAELDADAARGRRLRVEFRAMIAATRERLAALYAGTASDDEKRAGKAAAFAAMRAEHERQKAAADGVPVFDRWFAGGANNAGIAAAGLYADRVPQFKALLAAEGGDLPRFYERVKALAALPKARRELALEQVAGR